MAPEAPTVQDFLGARGRREGTMRCPRCDYHSPFEHVRCPQCQTMYEATLLEELTHLGYLHGRLEEWRARGVLPAAAADEALRLTAEETAALELALGLRGAASPAPAPVEVLALSVEGTLWSVAPSPAVTPVPQAAASDVPAPPILESPPPPDGSLAPAPETDRGAPGTPEREPLAGPAFSWRQVGTYLLSERTLNALLGLGAFFILASGVVISTLNPTSLSPMPHLGVVAITTLVFYAFGYILRQRLELRRTGATLLAIGAAFIPLDIWTLGNELLLWTPGTIWLAASLLCLPAYLASHALLRDRTFAVLTALAGGSEVLAVGNWLHVPLEWGFLALVLLGIGYVLLTRPLRQGWDVLAWALFWTAQIATPMVMALLMVAQYFPTVWEAALGQPLGGWFEYAIGGAWWLGTAFYALSGRVFQRRRYVFAAAWTLPFAFLFTLTKAPWDAAWYNLCLAVLALGYLACGRWPWQQPAAPAPVRLAQLLGHPASQVGLALTVVAALWPAQTPESRIPTLYLVTGWYALGAFLFRLLALRYAAAYLLPVAVAFSLEQLGLLGLAWFAPSWHNLAFALLAGGYLLFLRVGLRPLGDAGAPYTYRGLAREPVSQVALLLTLVAAFWPVPTLVSAVATLSALSLVYGAAAVLLRQRAWAYVAVALVPVAYGLLLRHLGVEREVRPLAWTVLAAALLAAAEGAVRWTGEARRPLGVTIIGLGAWQARFASPLFSAGYGVSLLALGLSLAYYGSAPAVAGVRSLSVPVIAAFLALVALYSLSAAARQTSLFLYPATWLFLIPFTATAGIIFSRLERPLPEHELARLLAVLGVGYLALASVLDRAKAHYALPLSLVGYVLSVATMFLSVLDRPTNVQVVGLSLLVNATSAWLVHRDRHASFLWVVARLFGDPAAIPFRTARAGFLYLSCWLFPAWLLLALSLWRPAPDVAHYGIALTVLAPLYVAAGRWFRGVATEYRVPWYLGGYALSAIGPLVATPDPTVRTVALALSVTLYAASTVVFRQSAWLYLVALLTPVVLWQVAERFAVPVRFYGLGLVGLSLAYGVGAVALHHGSLRRLLHPIRGTVGAYALPFFVVGYGMSALGLAIVATQERGMVALGFTLGALSYAAAALTLRQSVFSYPLAFTAAVAYVAGMLLTPLAPHQYGLGLLPGIAAYLALADLLRRRLDQASFPAIPRLTAVPRLDAWATPFSAVLYAGTIAVPILSWGDQGTWALAWWSLAAVYGASAALVRQPGWLYPALVAGLVAYHATTSALVPTLTFAEAMGALAYPTWVLFWLAYAVVRWWSASPSVAPWSLLGPGRALAHRWAAPLLVCGTGALGVATLGSVLDAEAGLRTAVTFFILLAVFAFLWQGQIEAWGSVVFAGIAFQEVLRLAGVPWLDQPPRWAAAALALTLLALVVQRSWLEALQVWRGPLSGGSIGVGAAAVAAAAGNQLALLSHAALQPLAVTTAVTGLTLVAHGFNRRDRFLAYLGVALLELGYMIQLVLFEVGQPQAFVLPAGIYLLAVAYLEWRRGTGSKRVLELAGLTLLLGTSVVQALGFLGAGFDRYAYDGFLLFESLALFGLGAALRWKRTFFGGSLALVVDVLILLSDPVRAMNRWYLMAIVGFTMIGLVIFLEQRRQQIPVWLDAWRQRLEVWD
ncbi:MAG: hypothetical protein HY689_03890 [Chloroflexi bacterium]|nr:hypothetical protein [Chloroflexota bacterium]